MHYCRTPVLGTRQYRCEPCSYEKTVYNSCGDRNCPNCSGAKRRDWLEKTRELVAPGVTCFQVIFTLPEELSSLALGNRKEMYDLLFQVAWRCLSRKIEKRMFKYLARYMTGGPISDLRILGEKDGRIWFLARSLKKGEG